MIDTKEIREKVNGEDRPDDVWFVETINALCDEIDDLEDRLERAAEYLAGDDI